MKPEDLALFDDKETDTKALVNDDNWADDGWGETKAPPAAKPASKPVGKLNFTDESTTPDAELRADREVSQKIAASLLGVSPDAVKPGNEAQFAAERAQVVPDDAPKNDANAPAKASKGKAKAAVTRAQAPSDNVVSSLMPGIDAKRLVRALRAMADDLEKDG